MTTKNGGDYKKLVKSPMGWSDEKMTLCHSYLNLAQNNWHSISVSKKTTP
jgi:hypothetical protein